LPPKISSNDWDRLFRPNAPRRGGPARALANLLIVGAVVGLLGGGAFFALRFGLQRAQESMARTAERIQTSNADFAAGQTAQALATPTAEATASAPTPTAAPQVIGRGSVASGGNLRSQPVVDPATVIGQICAGDQVEFLEQQSGADGALWYRIRVTATGGDCTPQRVTIGSLGWASSTLLSEPAP
jgi:hypothetical protein